MIWTVLLVSTASWTLSFQSPTYLPTEDGTGDGPPIIDILHSFLGKAEQAQQLPDTKQDPTSSVARSVMAIVKQVGETLETSQSDTEGNKAPRKDDGDFPQIGGSLARTLSPIFGPAGTEAAKQAAAKSYARALANTYDLENFQTDLLAKLFMATASGLSTSAHSVQYGRAIADAFESKMKSLGANASLEEMPQVIAASTDSAVDLIVPGRITSNPTTAAETSGSSFGKAVGLGAALLASSQLANLFGSPQTSPDAYAQEIGEYYGLDGNQIKILSDAFSKAAEYMSKISSNGQIEKAVAAALAETLKSLGATGTPQDISSDFAGRFAESMPLANFFKGLGGDSNSPDAAILAPLSSAIIRATPIVSNVMASPYFLTFAQIAASKFAQSISSQYHLNEYQAEILKDSLSSAVAAVGAGSSLTAYAIAIESAFQDTMRSNGIEIAPENVAMVTEKAASTMIRVLSRLLF